jgi:phytoene dehydrogenase-like protein
VAELFKGVLMPKYDVAIVGAGLGGLAAAALLSSKKKKVIVLERSGPGERAVGVYEKDGYTSCAAPTLSYGFERGGTFYELSSALGIVHSVSVQSPCYQVALPDHRITIYADQGETLEELRREFPREISMVMKFYRDLHRLAEKVAINRLSAFLTKHRSAAWFIGRYHFSRELMAFFDIQSLYFFQRQIADLSLVNLITLCDTPPLNLEGGFKKFADQLYSSILHQGGEIVYNQTVSEFALRDDRIIGISTKQGVIEADTILLNLLPKYDLSAIYLGIRDTVIPVGMCPEVLFLPDYTMPRDFISLSLSAKDDVACAPQGMRVLNMSYRSEQNSAVDMQALIDQGNRLIPFLNDNIVFRDEQRTADGEIALPASVTFKPIRSVEGRSCLSRGSQKNIFLLENARKSPLQAISEINHFVKKVS